MTRENGTLPLGEKPHHHLVRGMDGSIYVQGTEQVNCLDRPGLAQFFSADKQGEDVTPRVGAKRARRYVFGDGLVHGGMEGEKTVESVEGIRERSS